MKSFNEWMQLREGLGGNLLGNSLGNLVDGLRNMLAQGTEEAPAASEAISLVARMVKVYNDFCDPSEKMAGPSVDYLSSFKLDYANKYSIRRVMAELGNVSDFGTEYSRESFNAMNIIEDLKKQILPFSEKWSDYGIYP
jgi:hypothetical protein